jgi:hypothetical protein
MQQNVDPDLVVAFEKFKKGAMARLYAGAQAEDQLYEMESRRKPAIHSPNTVNNALRMREEGLYTLKTRGQRNYHANKKKLRKIIAFSYGCGRRKRQIMQA